jgi:hypothetical protein
MNYLKKSALLLLPLILLIPVLCSGKNTRLDLAAAAIPDSLKVNAHAVIRYDSTEVEMLALDKVKVKRYYAITILDEAGKQFGDLYESYSLISKINNIDGAFYDAAGKLIRRLKNKDIFDRSTFGTNGVFNSDERIKSYRFANPNYPYTVEYELEETLNATFFLPPWHPQISRFCSVQQSVFSLTYPEDLPVRDKSYQMPASLVKTETSNKGIVSKRWSVQGIKAFEEQPLSVKGNFNRPSLLLSPTRFELLGHKGKMDSWSNFGLFNYELNEGRDTLPAATRVKVHALVSGDTSTLQKVETLYRYMQQNTRYVADEYGLSGWQTFAASNVCTKGYGDCKGLVNYLKALLKEAGITAYATLANAGPDDYFKADPDFPANTFNHAILCIPKPKETIWVECTSSYLPAGYLSGFTANRYVLLCTEKGGALIKTPAYGKDKTFKIRKAAITYDEGSEAQKVSLHNYYSGLMQDDLFQEVKGMPKDKIREMVSTKFSFPSYKVLDYAYLFKGSQTLPAIEENVEAEVTGLVNKTPKRTFINVGWMSNPMAKIVQNCSRTKPLVLDKSFTVIDSITLVLPPAAELESMPAAKHIQYAFGTLDCTFQKEGDRIFLTRKYEQNDGVFTVNDFKDYQKLYHILNAEEGNLNVVLLNTAGHGLQAGVSN